MSIECTHCGSSHYKKNGKSKGSQRYVCKGCGRCFSDRVRKFSFADKARAIDMVLNNVGIRKTARFMGASPALILRWIKEFSAQLRQQMAQAGESMIDTRPDMIELDEVYTFIKKNAAAPSYGVLIAGGRVALLPGISEKD